MLARRSPSRPSASPVASHQDEDFPATHFGQSQSEVCQLDRADCVDMRGCRAFAGQFGMDRMSHHGNMVRLGWGLLRGPQGSDFSCRLLQPGHSGFPTLGLLPPLRL
jgi:hypothetical protein